MFSLETGNPECPLVALSTLIRQGSATPPPLLTGNALSYMSLRGAELSFHYPKCQDSFLSSENTAGLHQQPFD